MSLRVLIAGAGLGGLTLAHGLRQAGLEPLIFERAPAQVDLSASYRIHIDGSGARALRRCLPDELWNRFQQHSAAPTRGIAFATEQLRELTFIEESEPSYPISRAGLRQLLLHGMQEAVSFQRRVVGYDQTADGVRLHFADGTSADGDVIVGADGSASAIRNQLLPAARVVETGVASIAGKLHLSDRVRERLREIVGSRLLSQMTMVLPLRGMAMFIAPFLRRDGFALDLDLPEHLFWVVLGRSAELGGSRSQDTEHLRQLAVRHIEHAHPLLRWLVAEADAPTIVRVPLHTAEKVAAWPSSSITLLGDAIHTMTPLQGLGGNTALRDAALLCQQLVEADRGVIELHTAIGAYESAMRQYGFEAVQRSLDISNAVASTNTFGRVAFRTVLRVANTQPWLHRKLFQRPAA